MVSDLALYPGPWYEATSDSTDQLQYPIMEVMKTWKTISCSDVARRQVEMEEWQCFCQAMFRARETVCIDVNRSDCAFNSSAT